jgi:hypothetical protein
MEKCGTELAALGRRRGTIRPVPTPVDIDEIEPDNCQGALESFSFRSRTPKSL